MKKIIRVSAILFFLVLLLLGVFYYKEKRGKSIPKISQIVSSFKSMSISRGSREICLTEGVYGEVTGPSAPVLSIPFDLNDYSTKHWGIVPFCAKLRSGSTHGGLDFELKPNSKVFSSTDGIVEHTQVGKEEGSGEIIGILGDGFKLGYSGLTNLQVKTGDEVKRGQYIANTVLIPHGEHHVHLGITINGKEECPLKYMDEEFRVAFEQMFPQANYESQTDARCACECEAFTPSWR